jgi:hypothetical protein
MGAVAFAGSALTPFFSTDFVQEKRIMVNEIRNMFFIVG